MNHRLVAGTIPTFWLDFWDLHLFTLGKTSVTTLMLAEVAIAILVLLLFSGWLQKRAVARLLSHSHFDAGMRQTIGTLVRYSVLIVGFIVIMQTIGIDLTTLSVLAGAVGVGIGFGLQNIFSNFISGLIVMFERPIRLGDHVELSGADGDVVEIGARATKVRTGYGSIIIIPNQQLITGSVTTWNTGVDTSSVLVTVKAVAEAGPREVMLQVLAAAKNVKEVAASPEPRANVMGIDANGYSVELQAWVTNDAVRRKQAVSDLRLAIHDRFSRQGIKLSSL